MKFIAMLLALAWFVGACKDERSSSYRTLTPSVGTELTPLTGTAR